MTCLTLYITLRSGDVWFHLLELSVSFIFITFYVYVNLPLSSLYIILCDRIFSYIHSSHSHSCSFYSYSYSYSYSSPPIKTLYCRRISTVRTTGAFPWLVLRVLKQWHVRLKMLLYRSYCPLSHR